MCTTQEHLSAKARESLCKLLVLEKVKAGHVVCREGELGVTFYAIFKGRFTVKYAHWALAGLQKWESRLC